MTGLDNVHRHQGAKPRLRLHYLALFLLAGWTSAQSSPTCFARTSTSSAAHRPLLLISLRYRQQIDERIVLPPLAPVEPCPIAFSAPSLLAWDWEEKSCSLPLSHHPLYELTSLQR